MVSARAGRSSLGCLIMLLIASAVGYFGFNVGEAYLRYYRFRDAMTQQARFASHQTDAAIKRDLAFFADSIGLPDEAKDVSVLRTTTGIEISADYTEVVEFPYFAKPIEFSPDVQVGF